MTGNRLVITLFIKLVNKPEPLKDKMLLLLIMLFPRELGDHCIKGSLKYKCPQWKAFTFGVLSESCVVSWCRKGTGIDVEHLGREMCSIWAKVGFSVTNIALCPVLTLFTLCNNLSKDHVEGSAPVFAAQLGQVILPQLWNISHLFSSLLHSYWKLRQ